VVAGTAQLFRESDERACVLLSDLTIFPPEQFVAVFVSDAVEIPGSFERVGGTIVQIGSSFDDLTQPLCVTGSDPSIWRSVLIQDGSSDFIFGVAQLDPP
jgi:hypothetical protein